MIDDIFGYLHINCSSFYIILVFTYFHIIYVQYLAQFVMNYHGEQFIIIFFSISTSLHIIFHFFYIVAKQYNDLVLLKFSDCFLMPHHFYNSLSPVYSSFSKLFLEQCKLSSANETYFNIVYTLQIHSIDILTLSLGEPQCINKPWSEVLHSFFKSVTIPNGISSSTHCSRYLHYQVHQCH